MAALPVTGRLRAEAKQAHQHLAGVMHTATHLHQIGVGAEVARPHLGIRLEATGADDHALAVEVVVVGRRRDTHAVDVAMVAMDPHNPRIITEIDVPVLQRDVAPAHDLPQPAANSMEIMPGW